jgi:hypothetical protein
VEVVRGMGVERAGEQIVLGDDVHRSGADLMYKGGRNMYTEAGGNV